LFVTIAEERQDQNAKRRKLENQNREGGFAGPSPTMALTAPPVAPSSAAPSLIHPSLPPRPTYDFAAKADSIGLGATPTPLSVQNAPIAAQALAGSNRDVVANRRAIRMANMSAAEMLKAELSGVSPVKPDPLPPKPPPPTTAATPTSNGDVIHMEEDEVPGLGNHNLTSHMSLDPPNTQTMKSETPADCDMDAEGDPDPDVVAGSSDAGIIGRDTSPNPKRKFEEGPGSNDVPEDVVVIEEEDDDAPSSLILKVNADGTVEQEDTVKFVQQPPPFMSLSDLIRTDFGSQDTKSDITVKNLASNSRTQSLGKSKLKLFLDCVGVFIRCSLTKSYVEGLAWVLHYYYQGVGHYVFFHLLKILRKNNRRLPGSGITLTISRRLPQILAMSTK
jgi:5'-3' exoribonuclease 2